MPNLNLLINKKLKISLSIILFSLLVFTINHTFYQIYQLIYQNQLTNRVERNWVKLKSALTDKTFLQLVQSSDWDRLQELYEKNDYENTGIFIYSGDSLVYWSTNNFLIDDTINNEYIIKNDRGIFLCFSKDTFNYHIVLAWQLQNNYLINNEYLTNRIDKQIDPLGCFAININNDKTSLEQLEFVSIPVKYSKTQNFIALFCFLLLLVGLYFLFTSLADKWEGSKKVYILLITIIIVAYLLWLLLDALSSKYYIFNPSFFALSLTFNNIGKIFLILWLGILAIKLSYKLLPIRFRGLFYFVISLFLSGNIFIWLYKIFNATEFPYSYYEWIVTKIDVFFVILLAIILLAIWIWVMRLMIIRKPSKKIVYSGFIFYVIFLILLLKDQSFFILLSMGGMAIWLIVYLFTFIKKRWFKRYFVYVFGLIIIAITSGLFMYVHHQSFSNYLLLNAVKISSERDLILENHLQDLKNQIANDEIILKYTEHLDTNMNWLTYLKDHYLSSFQEKYDILGFICCSNDIFLNNNNQISCWNYYDSIIGNSQTQYISDELYYITNADVNYYLFSIKLNSELPHYLFIEFYKKQPFRPEGYLELLVNADEEQLLPAQIDYATYFNDNLLQSYGNTIFPLQADIILQYAPTGKLFKYNGKYSIKSEIDNEKYIVLVSNHSLPSWISIFCYFTIIVLLLYIFYYLFFKRFNLKKILRSFASRLQLTLILIITIVIFVSGSISVKYLQNTYLHQLQKRYFERNYGLYLSLQNEIINNDINADNINALLWEYKYSYFSDLHYYNIDGRLLSSTQFALFQNKLLTELINPKVYWYNYWQNYWYYTNQENIGNFIYWNAYFPIFMDKKVVGILSIPMFNQISELRSDLSELIGTFINIYTILLLISLIITFLITQYINRPLKLISKRLKTLSLSRQNEKISYRSNDEIGQLVRQYNQMVDELAEKAEKLAQSEREMAWREMAKQVAHEIKNPLTPMKLSVQFLQKTWKNDKQRFEKDIDKYLATLLEQIEHLSDIATAFSQFNKMPEPVATDVDLVKLLQNLVALFQSEDYDIMFTSDIDELFIHGDENRLNRAFTNIIKNAVQSFVDDRRGLIKISIKTENEKAIITIEDNGSGIPEAELTKIFEPNFTTKTSGSGLGLAIVKNIINDLNGQIYVESKLGEGSKFIIFLNRLIK